MLALEEQRATSLGGCAKRRMNDELVFTQLVQMCYKLCNRRPFAELFLAFCPSPTGFCAWDIEEAEDGRMDFWVLPISR